jgi:cytochrome c oxidase assembly protein subunit 11
MTNPTVISTLNQRTALKLSAVVLGMFGFGFALVPLYDVICEVTGLNGRSANLLMEAETVEHRAVDDSRTVTVEFIGIVNQGLDWHFAPEVARMEVHPGQQYVMNFVATNRRDAESIGQAVPSVAPSVASRHFNKTECFCFSRQVFGPHESREMPVAFVVDPRLRKDVGVVTLAYTFFELHDVAQQAATSALP